jgi:hypothetical protein
MIIDGTSIKNQIHIETLSFSAVFQNICFTRLRLSDFLSNNNKMLENMTCILSAISDSIDLLIVYPTVKKVSIYIRNFLWVFPDFLELLDFSSSTL